MNANTLIIAGMHRSGTSMISQWLNRCGLNIGQNLMSAGTGNADGHFEDLDFYRFHKDALVANDLCKTGFVTKPVDKLSPYYSERLQRLIAFKKHLNDQWGWKDPRTCLFLSHYRKLLPDAYYLNVIRDYRSTVSSMIHRDFAAYESKYRARPWLSRQVWSKIRRPIKMAEFYRERSAFYLQVWLRYNEEILKNIQMLPANRFLVIDHRNLFEHDKEVFTQLKNDWNFDLSYCDFKNVFKENLLSKVVDVERYISDKCLISKAVRLEEMLRQYI